MRPFKRNKKDSYQMINIKSGDGEPGHADGNDEGRDGHSLRLGIPDDEQEDGLATESSAVEQLSNVGRRHDLFPTQIIGKLTAKRHNHSHHLQDWKKTL
jgi:hypothetical protein